MSDNNKDREEAEKLAEELRKEGWSGATTEKKETIEIIEIENLEDKVGDVDFPRITGFRVSSAILAIGIILNWLSESPQLQFFALFGGLFVLWKGFVKVQHTERYVVERLGKFWRVLKPGPHILLYGIDEIVAILDTKAKDLPLFKEVNKDPKKTVDFKKSAELGVTFGVWYIIADAQRAAYFTGNIEKFIGDTVENIARRVFGETHIGKALESKFEVEKKANGYLIKPLGELAKNLDKRYLEILNISTEEAKKLSPSMLLMLAGVRITQIYFTDVDLCDETIKARAEIFKTLQQQQVTEEQVKVEEQQVSVEEQKKAQEKIKGTASGERMEEELLPLVRKGLTVQEATTYLINREKYSGGVDQISEINIGSGGDKDSADASADAMVAKIAAIFGKTAQEAGSKKPAEPKKRETESEK